MADGTINYDVNVDTSSLASQLQQIKQQVDTAMATYTFNATLPDPYPKEYSFPAQQFGEQARQLSADINTGAGIAQGQATEFMNSTRLGFQKFAFDVQNAMLATPIGMPALPLSTAGIGGALRNMAPARAAFEAATGWSYDPRMSMSPGRYMQMAGDRLSDQTVELTHGLLDIAASATGLGAFGAKIMGSSAAPALTAIAVPLGIAAMGFSTYESTFGYDIGATLKGRAFARDTSWRSLTGRMTNEEATTTGVDIATAARSQELVGMRVTQNEAMGMIEGFSNIGGFESARTADEFRDRIKTVVNNTRKIVEVLQVTQNEALGMMKQYIDMGLIGDNGQGANALILSQAAVAFRAGITPTEMNRVGTQTVEMTRGTGIYQASAFLGGQQGFAGIQTMRRTGALGEEVLSQLGGVENAAMTEARMGYDFGMSPAGLTAMAAISVAGPNAAGMAPVQQLGTALGRIRGISDFLGFKGAQGRMAGQLGPEALMAVQTSQMLGSFQLMQKATGTELNEDTWRAYQQTQGFTVVQSDLAFAGLRQAQTVGTERAFGETISEFNRQAIAERPAWWSIKADQIGNIAADVLGTRGQAVGWGQLANTVSNAWRGFNQWTHPGADLIERNNLRLDVTDPTMRNILLHGTLPRGGVGEGSLTFTTFEELQGKNEQIGKGLLADVVRGRTGTSSGTDRASWELRGLNASVDQLAGTLNVGREASRWTAIQEWANKPDAERRASEEDFIKKNNLNTADAGAVRSNWEAVGVAAKSNYDLTKNRLQETMLVEERDPTAKKAVLALAKENFPDNPVTNVPEAYDLFRSKARLDLVGRAASFAPREFGSGEAMPDQLVKSMSFVGSVQANINQVLRGMHVDLNTMTPQDVTNAGTALIVAELRKLTAAQSSKANALYVKQVIF